MSEANGERTFPIKKNPHFIRMADRSTYVYVFSFKGIVWEFQGLAITTYTSLDTGKPMAIAQYGTATGGGTLPGSSSASPVTLLCGGTTNVEGLVITWDGQTINNPGAFTFSNHQLKYYPTNGPGPLGLAGISLPLPLPNGGNYVACSVEHFTPIFESHGGKVCMSGFHITLALFTLIILYLILTGK